MPAVSTEKSFHPTHFGGVAGVEKVSLLPLTHPQKRELITEKTYPDTAFANIPFTVRLGRKADFNLLAQSINNVIFRHQGLRIRIVEDGYDYKQYIKEPTEIKLDFLDFSSDFGRERLDAWIRREAEKPLNLIDSDLFYFALLRFSPDDDGFFMKLHHIVADGWTAQLLIRQIVEDYNYLAEGGTIDESPAPEYTEYVLSEESYLESPAFASDREFWKREFEELPQEIKIGYAKKKGPNIKTGLSQFSIPEPLGRRILEFCSEHNTSYYRLITSVVSAYLSKITRLKDITLGVLNHNRRTDRERQMAGMFVNTIPLKINVDGDSAFLEHMGQCREKLKELISHRSRYPFDCLITDLRERFGKTPNLLNVILVGLDFYCPGALMEHHHPGYEQPPFQLLINIMSAGKDPSRLELQLVYPEGMFETDDTELMFNHIINAVEAILADPSVKLSEIDFLSPEEKTRLLTDFSGKIRPIPEDETLDGLFLKAAEKFPKNTAAVFKDQDLTYEQLKDKVESLARHLSSMGAGPGQVVGIMAEPSIYIILAPLAILRTGAAYLPIDPRFSPDRIDFMLKDCGARILLTHGELFEKSMDFKGKLINLDLPSSYSHGKEPLPGGRPGDIAYIIYTSGSTGKPKGVPVRHRSAVNMCDYCKNTFNLTEKDRTTKFAGFGFDASVFEIYPSLASGCAIYVIEEEFRVSPRLMADFMEKNHISYSFLPTQFLEEFMALPAPRSLRIVTAGGDKLNRFVKTPYQIWNLYGPTEYTVVTTGFLVDRFYENIPVGKPVYNTRCYILDDFNKLQPVEIAGELCISGEGISPGYLNRPELIKEKFTDNPLEPGMKMYRTGDLARWKSDGNIEFLGRIDFQVKIRGFRIELGEVEKALLKVPGVKESVVLALEDSRKDKFLCGYYTADRKIEEDEIVSILKKGLPDYEVPSFFVQLERMPLNPSGKIDRKSLPRPVIKQEMAKPENNTEEALLQIFQSVLGLSRCGVTDGFFAMGGHSLRAAQLQAEVLKTFGVEISSSDIFNKPTVRQLSEIIIKARKSSLSSIAPAPKASFYPASPAQKRLFIIEQLQGVGVTYNVPIILDIRGPLDRKKLVDSFDKLVERHESLRTCFELKDGEPVQVICDNVKYKKIFKEIRPEDTEGEIAGFVRPFNLSKAPLFRVELLKTGADRHLLVMDFHHTIFDGSSMIIFVRELMELYSGRELPPLAIQYKDFALWQHEMLKSDVVDEQEKYWLGQFRGEIPILDLPSDFSRPTVQDYRGKRLHVSLDRELTANVHAFCTENGVTPFMLLMACYNLLLARYSSQEDIVVGAGSAGRNRSELSKVVGMFVNTLPVRNKPEDELTFTEFLTSVRENLLKAFDNQDYPFDRLVEKLNIKRDSSRNPLFDAAMVYQSMGFDRIDGGSISVKPYEYDSGIAHIDLMLEVIEDEGQLLLNWEYRTSLYRERTIRRMAGHLENIIRNVLKNPKVKLKDTELLSPAETHQLLYDFNETDAGYPKDAVVHRIFEEMAEKYPDNTAVVYGNEKVTYRQLNEKANRIARMLRSKGVKSDSIVAIMLDKCPLMIAGLLGIIKAGGCYLPMKPEFPDDRISYMLEDSKTPILLTTSEYMGKASDFKGEKIDFSDESIYSDDASNLECINSPEDMIYIIYTSGSTGKPKGVMLEHRNIVRLFINDRMQYSFNEKDIWSMFHSFCFDFSVWEMYGALLYGGSMVIVPKDCSVNPAAFLQLLKDHGVTVLSQTPGAFYNLINEDLKSDDRDLHIRYVTFGGEALKPAMLKAWHEKYPQTKLINMYGITETTVHVTFKEITSFDIEAAISNIGVPIPTLRTYILNRNLKLLPVGVPGEICVAGDGLARGYLGRKDLTDKVFVENPHVKGERIYRSGDLARMLPTGEMEYLGRIDFQVKIRGFRIELGEIENRLLKHPSISKAVVIAKDDSEGAKFLAAYYESEKALTVNELREYLLKELPDYMVPSYFIRLDVMPLTPNGKVARNLLPEPDEKIDTGSEFIASRTETEKQIVLAWQKVLGVEHISIFDNFFALGGHSLKAVALAAELQKNFQVTVNDIFEHQTVAELAEVVIPLKENLKTRISQLKSLPDKNREDAEKVIKSRQYAEKLARYREMAKPYKTMELSKTVDYKNVLLTGATGYLGVHVLESLLTGKNCNVWVIVRGDAEKRLDEMTGYYFGAGFLQKHKDRIKILSGDLAADNLGLKQDEYNELAQSADCIIHTAANVRHYGHYDEFYGANVKAPMNLVELCRTGRRKDMNHISTLSVVEGHAPGVGHLVLGEWDLDLGQRHDNYYVRTKFEAEQVMQKAREEGLKVNVFRVGNITLNSTTGHLQKNIEENAFYLQMKAFLNLGVVPDQEDQVEFSFVDRLARVITLLFDREQLSGETYNILNPAQVKISELLTSPELDLSVEKLAFGEFIDFLEANYDREAFRPYVEAVMLHRGWMGALGEREEDLTEKLTGFTILSEKTDTVLERLGFRWPDLKPETLMDMILEAFRERIKFLKTVPLFTGVDERTLKTLALGGRQKIYADETDVLWEGDPVDGLSVITDGHVEVSGRSGEGWLGTIGLLGNRDWFGRFSSKGPLPSDENIEAVFGDLSVLSLRGKDILKAMGNDAKLSQSLMEELFKRLSKMERILINIG